jgi:VanZ family protein
MRTDLRHARLWLAGGWLMIAIVVVICLLPGPDIEPVAHVLPDKAEHAIAFFGLTAWFCGLYPRPRWGRVALAFLLLGVLIEVAQGTFTTTRSMDYKDALADAAGIATALILARAGLGEWGIFAERFLPAARP